MVACKWRVAFGPSSDSTFCQNTGNTDDTMFGSNCKSCQRIILSNSNTAFFPATQHHVFISCMYSKAGIQLIRLSAILCAFENAFDLISSLDIANKLILNNDIVGLIKEKIAEKEQEVLITDDNLTRAKKLLDYFIINRLVLAGFKCNLKFDSNEDDLKRLLQLVISKKEMKIDLQNAKLILLMPGKEVECLDIIAKKKFKQLEILKIVKILEEKKMGPYEERRAHSSRGPVKKLFIKRELDSSIIDEDFIANLEAFDIDIATYKEMFDKGIF